MKKKTAVWLLLLLGAAAAVFPCISCRRDSASVKIGISIPSADHGWTGGVVFWAEQAKKDLEKANPGVEVIVSSAKDSAEQVDQIERLLVQGIRTLVVLPNEPEPLLNVCEKVKSSNVNLVVVDRGLPRDIADLVVAGDNVGFGRVAGEALAARLGGNGRIVIMEGVLCQVNTDRVEAFRAALKKYPGIEILDSGVTNWSTEKGLSLMENFLQKFPQIDAVWTGDDDVLIGALKAYEESKRSDVKFFIGGGGSKAIIRKVMDGDPLIPLTVTYPPRMIYVAAQEGLKLTKGEKPAVKKLIVPAEVIDISNAKDNYFPESAY